MATQWQTFPIEFRGGLISNLSELQQGTNAVGSATVLQNFEVSKEGGYTKIRGFSKYSTTEVPGTGPILALKVISSGRIIAARKVDAAAVTETNSTANVNGAVSSSTSVAVDGNSGTIVVGMTVSGTGISGSPTVATVTDQNNIVLSSAQTLADNTILTFSHLDSVADLNKTAYYYSTGTTWNFIAKSASTNGGKARHVLYNLDGDDKVIFVDGTNYPMIYNTSGNTGTFLTASDSTDVSEAEHIAIFKNTAFYSQGNDLFFSAPFTVDDFTAANGAGSINVANNITGLAVFRDQLIIFTQDSVKRLTGSSSADFTISPITDRIGCINGDTIQEIGGDIIYLAPDGIRLLSATDRIGDFALDIPSDRIAKDANKFLSSTSNFSSFVIREKNQYRIFAYVSSEQTGAAKGLIATKFISQGAEGLQWSTTKGIKANVADSRYSGTTETIAFANEDGFVYELDTGSSFGGANIEAIYESPYMPLTDPQIRKTFYKFTLYAEPESTMSLDVNLKYDNKTSSDTSTIQPPTITVGSSGNAIFLLGASTSVFCKRQKFTATASQTAFVIQDVEYTVGTDVAKVNVTINGVATTAFTVASVADGDNFDITVTLSSGASLNDEVVITLIPPSVDTQTTFGGDLETDYSNQLVGSGKTVAVRITDDSTNPRFTLDTMLLDFMQNDRQ